MSQKLYENIRCTESLSDSALGASRVMPTLAAACVLRYFDRGETVRSLGNHYSDTLLILDGQMKVDLGHLTAFDKVRTRTEGPIGEIGFLNGTPACATIVAACPTQALILDDETLASIRQSEPDIAAAVLQMLAEYSQRRLNDTFGATESLQTMAGGSDFTILLCRTQQQLHQAQKLRYDVYCRELGRSSPAANHDKGIIADQLDALGKTFIAVSGGEAVGTLRANLATDAALAALESLYGMKLSTSQSETTAVCTKLIIKPAARGGPAAMQLIAALTRHLLMHNIQQCFIDCIPSLLHYYRAMGFEIAGEQFCHPENGPSIPLRIDLRVHGKILSGALGLKNMMRIYVKAKGLKLMSRLQNNYNTAHA